MKIIRKIILYISLILVFGGFIFYILRLGGSGAKAIQIPDRISSKLNSGAILSFSGFKVNLQEALPVLLLQIVVIMATTSLLGRVFKMIGQPAVIGETIAGILLGPSLLGLLFPGIFHFIFPDLSLVNLRFLSQIGLILFMFIVGMELDTGILKKQAFEALIISHAGILIPFSLGVFLSLFLYDSFARMETGFYSFALFMGIAMSITAFPVLARIIRDRNLTGSKIGVLALGSAASDDVTAWCMLAILVALIRSGSGTNGLLVIGLVILYSFIMLLPVRKFLQKLLVLYEKGRIGYSSLMVILFTLLLCSAWSTEVIGIHALFGAFLAGIVLPKNSSLQIKITERISDLTLVLLLPLFFVYTGLRTQAGILQTGGLWLAFGMILLCAVAGKFGGSTLITRALGQSWQDSLRIGALMNTRGLMELIVLNIGYDMGILSTEIFSMMVLMALLTTMMTCPILNWINRWESRRFQNTSRTI